jgi:hypothetical protein
MSAVNAVQLAAIHYEHGFAINEFLTALGQRLRADGVPFRGAIQVNAPGAANPCSDMSLVDLATGERMKISQDLGSQAIGCRLDSGKLAEFGSLLDRTCEEDAALIILNKFGKAESEGHGLRPNFIRAIETGVPVLTAVRPPHDEAWRAFHGGLAAQLPVDLEAARRWCLDAVAQRATAA